MDMVKLIRTQKLLETQAFEAGRECEVGERKKKLDQLIKLGETMGLEPHDAAHTAREAFLAGCEVSKWKTWGL